MMDKLNDRYPNLSKLLQQGPFPQQVQKAVGICTGTHPQRSLYDARKGKQFGKANELIWHTCSPFLPGFREVKADEIEADLAALIATGVPDGKLAESYKAKLLNDDQFEDVRYEVAAGAICCGILDKGTMGLETGLVGKLNNTDITGRWGSRKARFEVTVLHDNWLTGLDAKNQAIIEAADIDGGYEVVLGKAKVTGDTAARIKTLIEELHAKYKAAPRQDIAHEVGTYWFCGDDDIPKQGSLLDRITLVPDLASIDDFIDKDDFSDDDIVADEGPGDGVGRGHEYRCSEKGSLIARITFVPDRRHRVVLSAAVSRSTMDRHEVEQLPQPPGVVSALEHETETHQPNPYNTAIWQKLKEKAEKQCETGAVNVIVLGQPSPVNDLEVEQALLGVLYVDVPFTEATPGGAREGSDGIPRRTVTGPFLPASQLPDDRRDEITQANKPFEKVSAVLMLRLDGGHAKARLFRNPNAAVQLADADEQALLAAAQARCDRTPPGSPMDPLTADGAAETG